MSSRVYDLFTELSEPALRTNRETNILMDELKERLEQGESRGKFRAAVLDTYYVEFIKAGIREFQRNDTDISDSLYYPVLEILFRRYMVHPDNTDDKGITPMKYATTRKCSPFISYLQSKGAEPIKKPRPKPKTKTKTKPKTKPKTNTKTKPKTKPKPKKTPKTGCEFRTSTSRCVNGTHTSRTCYRHADTKRCRKKR